MSRKWNRSDARRGFTLVEMLVVLGIIAIVMSLVIPAVMRARRAGRTAQCMNNLRQVGALLLMRAHDNGGYTPFGCASVCNAMHLEPDFRFRADWNDFIWSHGQTSGALGPMLADGTLHRENASILYCPTSVRPELRWDVKQRLFPFKGESVTAQTIRIGYAVRPHRQLWIYTGDCPPEHAPRPLKLNGPSVRLDQLVNKVLMAEAPERPPYNHGTQADPFIHALFYDGGVRAAGVKAWKDVKEVWFEEVDQPYYSPIDNASSIPVWEVLDRQFQ